MNNKIRQALINAGHEPVNIKLDSTPRRTHKINSNKINKLSLGEQFYLSMRLRGQRSMTMPIYRYIKND